MFIPVIPLLEFATIFKIFIGILCETKGQLCVLVRDK